MTSTVRSSDGRVVLPARLRSRRVEVKRNEGRRRLRRVVALVVVAAIVAGGWALVRSPLFAVNHISVLGSSHVNASDVARASGITKGVAMMDVNPARARKKLAALPWVATAHVSREWPNRIRIHLVDRKPVAQVATGTTFALVDETGRVLQTGVKPSSALPTLERIRIPAAGHTVAAAAPLIATAAALPASYRNQVRSIGFDSDGSVALTLTSDGVVSLGGAAGLTAKFTSLSTVLGHLGGLAKGCTLDVSVPLSPTLTPEQGCA